MPPRPAAAAASAAGVSAAGVSAAGGADLSYVIASATLKDCATTEEQGDFMAVRNMAVMGMLVVIVLSSSVAGAAEPAGSSVSWPQFLGPNRNGITPATNLLDQWPEGGPAVVWRAAGGVGMSAVAVSQGRAITMWNDRTDQLVVALDANDGSKIWSTTIAPAYENGQGDGPRGTPAIVDDQVYCYSGQGVLSCLRLSDGETLWSENLVASAHTRAAEYGMACSPLVVDDLVIVTVGGSGTAVVAVDRHSGRTMWTAGDGAPGYASPMLLNVTGENQVVAFTAAGLSGLNPNNGSQLWLYPFKTPYDCNTASPISVAGNVFISAGENHGCAMLSIEKRGSGYQVSEVWQSVNVKSVMRNEWQTSLAIEGHLYGFDNVGSAGATTHLGCIDAATGNVVWRQNRFGKGNLVSDGRHLWITTMAGELVMVKATPAGYQELGRAERFGKTRQTLSIAGGKAYIRDNEEVVCIELSDSVSD